MLKRHPVLWLVLLTVLLSFAVYFLPLPVEQKSLLVLVLLVFIPAVICVPQVFLTEGRQCVRQLFSRRGTAILIYAAFLFIFDRFPFFAKPV